VRAGARIVLRETVWTSFPQGGAGMMRHVDVESTLIHSIGYDEEKRTLEVRFHDGDTYRYYDVEPEVVEEFFEAESKGSFFNAYVRDAYLFTKLW
jgi:hypothetical protein